MPNLIVHMSLAIILTRLLGIERRDRWVLLLGALLPDLQLFIALVAFIARDAVVAMAVSFFLHTPVGVIFFCLMAASFIDRDLWKAFGLLYIGALSNILLDSFLYPWARPHHFLLLWPFSWRTVGFPLIAWMGTIEWALVIVAAVAVARDRSP